MPGLVIERVGLQGGAAATLGARTTASERCGMALAQRTYALTYDELEALRRLHAQSPVQDRDDPVWGYLLSLRLVWLDTASEHSTHRLTSAGRGYAAD
jgi:hypothetical protein